MSPGILHPDLYLGTSSWSSKDWEGVFYPEGTAPRDYLAHYATRYRTVEADSTWYRTPSRSTVRRWRTLLPPGFLLSAKFPRTITHEKILLDCRQDLEGFLTVMETLGEALGPLLLQFPYFSKASGMTAQIFQERLCGFLPTLSRNHRYALEIRNKTWLQPRLLEVLKEHGVALALLDHPWMPGVDEILSTFDPVTAPFSYIRWLGDRRGIESITKSWDRVILNRSQRARDWITAIKTLLQRKVTVLGYFNNHYAGHAPGSIDLFERLWNEMAITPTAPD